MDQTNYPTYRQRDMTIGSRAVESIARQLAIQRAKGPGMNWTAEGLEELDRIKTNDVSLPTSTGREIRIRCVAYMYSKTGTHMRYVHRDNPDGYRKQESLSEN